MYIDGMLGFLLGIFLIWGGYAVSVVICTTIAEKIENGAKKGDRMAEIIRKYRDKYNNLVTEYKCSVCGKPTLRYRGVGNRRALCLDCMKREEKERLDKHKHEIYCKGCKDTVDEVKSLVKHYLIDGMDINNVTKCVDDLMDSIELLREQKGD